MAKEHIFIVDDEEDILRVLEYNLSKEGYKVTSSAKGDGVFDAVKSIMPDLIVLDLMLPGVNGLDICRQLKNDSATNHIPIIMLTAKGEESDIVIGLELGADDYIPKPFNMKVLKARIRVVLRRKKGDAMDENSVIALPDLVIHPGRHEVLVQGEPVRLTFTEFKILHSLARRPGWVFTRYQIVDAVRGEEYPVTER
ncbi:response regulator transcription factor, partial [bacterium]|nr:response regulator transcription factor [bacterium]